MKQMQIIGGEEFLDITIDKNKLIEALTLYQNMVYCKDCIRYHPYENSMVGGICSGVVGMPATHKCPNDYCSKGFKR